MGELSLPFSAPGWGVFDCLIGNFCSVPSVRPWCPLKQWDQNGEVQCHVCRTAHPCSFSLSINLWPLQGSCSVLHKAPCYNIDTQTACLDSNLGPGSSYKLSTVQLQSLREAGVPKCGLLITRPAGLMKLVFVSYWRMIWDMTNKSKQSKICPTYTSNWYL